MALSEALERQVEHGGSLERARALFPGAPLPFVDLSTGINPHSYPHLDLPATALSRLPEPQKANALAELAALAYGAPSASHVVPAPGTQILLPRVYALAPPGRALILGPTYAEHARAASIAGHSVGVTGDFAALAEADLAVVVNPNNPDGRVVQRPDLLRLAESLAARGGMLVVDEAFMDVGPAGDSVCRDVAMGNIVVLRSFGKFFGLAGVRLGFAVADIALARRLAAEFGPWAVSGPALEYGLRALADTGWQNDMRLRLAGEAQRLDDLLADHGITVTGGTSLFRRIAMADAGALFETLGSNGVFVRGFSDRPGELRVGLPGSEAEWLRVGQALAAWSRTKRGATP